MPNPKLSKLTLPVKDPDTEVVTMTEFDLPASGSSITVDDEISSTSENPVQNKVISAALDEKANEDDLGTAATKDVPTSGDATATQVVMGNDSRLTDARNAADVSAWAKADTKPSYTAAEVGAIPTTQKGANSGVAELDENGKVPSSQLPSYVDDVLEYDSIDDLPLTGETGKIYVVLDTNKTYRWSGSAYVVISPSLALGETSSTAYRGDRGKTAYDHASAKGSAFSSGLYKITTNAEGHVTAATAVEKADITGLGIPGSDTNTHRPIQVNGTEILGNNTTALNLKAGSNVSVSNSSGTVTIAATDTTYGVVSKTANGLAPQLPNETTTTKYLRQDGSWVVPPNDNTKNTAGSTDTSSKIFLIGATSQAANPQTYSHDTAYVGTDGCLYSGGSKVLTAHDGNNRKSFYGTCETAAGTAAKVVTLSESAGWPGLVAGLIVGVKFTNTNTYSSATSSPITLNVNSTGAKNIWYANTHSGAGNTGTNTTAYGRASYINYYMYDGTYWVWLSSSTDNNTTYSAMSSSELTTGTATTSRVVRADYLKAGIQSLIDASVGAAISASY